MGSGLLERGINGETQTFYVRRRKNRCTIDNTENELYSDLGFYYASPKMKARKLNKTKPKRKEDFRVGRISNWKDFLNTGGREEGHHGVGKNSFKWKVYSR